ncbi:ABC1 kinase family protein [Methanobacterium congolense]|uniref:ABC1 atypical kinase-like domain-containing protein n=1 Tax=Methanobacterium congolense TaxID=118062 RepID=A0A1D3L5K4_9EURY|nr:AarF/ABC1/UbiB kinase family protein [Methanobacterium congolense]SCG86901.1 putative protein sll1770 [Methanobacterium congolense]
MNIIPEDSRPNIKRLREILVVLAEYEFGSVIEKIGLRNRLPFSERFYFAGSVDEELDSSVSERLRLVLEDLGTTFIKLGQVISTRPDLVGDEVSQEFTKLQDNTPPFEYEIVKSRIEEELGAPIGEVFSSFDEKPLAAASVGQVHRALLKDGSAVAVKVQRPDLETLVKQDITIMRYLANLIDKRIPKWQYYNLPGIVDEFERSILKEINYGQEARNAKRFKTIFKGDKSIYVPEIYDEYCTSHVLTMEFIEGVKVRDIMENPELGEKFNGKTIARRGAESYFKQVLIHGFFHADPHPGNIYVLKNNVVCFLDFGMMGHIDDEFREELAELFIFIINYDIKGIISQLIYMGIVSENADLKSLKYDIMDLMDRYYDADLKELGKIIKDLGTSKIMEKYQIKLPRDFVLLGRVITMVEDMGQKLDPEFNGVEISKPLAKKLVMRKLSPLRILDFIGGNFFEFEHLMKILPRSISKTMMKLEEGKINIEMEHKNLDALSANIDRSSNRISLSLIIAALIIGSSLIMQTNKGILILGFPFLGIIGFIISAVLGIALVISILRYSNI